jgi:hypothetical protein
VSTKFVMFKMLRTNADGGHDPILINPAHVRTAHQSGPDQVILTLDHGHGGGTKQVAGDLQTVWKMLTGEVNP